MRHSKHSFAAAVASVMAAVLFSLSALPLVSFASAARAEEEPAVVLTEVCFNPTFEENNYGLDTSADIFEYMELYNRSDLPVSLAGLALERSTKGYDGDYSVDPILPPDEGDGMLAPGEFAIIAVITGDGYTAGLRTATPKDRAAYYQRFVDFYDCADRLPQERFYIADVRDNETGEVIGDRFHLTNTNKDVVYRVTTKAGILCSARFSPVEWNRNGYALNLTYRAGGVDGHPEASAAYNIGAPTPGLLRDNQLSTEGMTPAADLQTLPLQVMEYNICATDSTQTHPDGSAISMDERIGHTFDIIRGYDPDILALCEINYLWTPRLEAEMTGEDGAYEGYGRSSKGATYGSRRINRETWDLFNLILWKDDRFELVDKGTFWCSSTPSRAGTFTWEDGLVGDFARGINWVILRDRATKGEIFVLCGHIDAKVPEARRRSAELIVKEATTLADGRPAMLLGDWNSNERSTSYAELTAGGFADARYRIPDPAAMSLYGTGNGWGGYSDFRSRAPIDHCIITPHNVFVESAKTDPGYFDEAGTLVAADHNATIFSLRAALHRDPALTETEAPTDTPTGGSTESETDDPTNTPAESAADSAADTPMETVTESVTNPSTSASTEASAEGGCASAFGGGFALMLLAGAAVALRRKA